MSIFSGKNIMVTSGGTREYLDDVRVITNISTGALGANIAESLYRYGARVHYVHGVNARMPVLEGGYSDGSFIDYPIKSCADLHQTMKAIIPAFKMDGVVHSAAVSDFTFKREEAIKISSSSPEDFIELLRKTITRTPKIIQDIKSWYPETTLVGFKFTVSKTYGELITIAEEMAEKSGCDAVFANDKTDMINQREHVGILLDMITKQRIPCKGKDEIAYKITQFLGRSYEKN